MLACKEGRTKIVVMLLTQKNLNKNLRDAEFEGSALYWACFYEKIDQFKILLEAGFDADEKVNTLSLLHHAVLKNNEALLKMLIDYQKDLNAQDRNGNTPLHTAADLGSSQIARTLLSFGMKKGIDCNLKNVVGKSSLDIAIERGKFDVVSVLLEHEAQVKENLLHIAVTSNNQKLLEVFISHKKDLNVQDGKGNTPLHIASELGFVECVKILLAKSAENGININAKNLDDKSPLHLSAEQGKEELVVLLLLYGALANEEDRYNKTPLMYAVDKEDIGVCTALIKKFLR